MGVGDLAHDTEQTDSSSEPSVSYLYLYEKGRDEIENWSEDAQEVMAKAYAQVSNGGTVRGTFNRSGQYENIHHATAELMVGIGEVFENGNFQPLLDFVGPDADAVGKYLDENPEVREELVSRLQEHESQQE